MTAKNLSSQLLVLPLVAFLWPSVTPLRGADAATPSPINLRFSPTILALSPDSTLAVGAGVFDPMGRIKTTTPIVVVDLKKQEVICNKSLPLDIGPVAIDSQFVYAASQVSDVLYVLSHKDLSQVRRMYTKGRINGLACVDNRLLFIRSNGLSVLKVPSLEPATKEQVGVGIHEFGNDKSTTPGLPVRPGVATLPGLPVRLGDGWWFDGVYYDEHLQNALVVAQPRGFWQGAGDLSANQRYMPMYQGAPPRYMPMYEGSSQRYMPMYDDAPSWLHPWGITVDSQGIHHGQQLVGQFRQPSQAQPPYSGLMVGNFTAAVLTEQPAAVSLHQEGNNFNEPHRRAELLFQDLVSGLTPFQIVLINEEEQTPQQFQPLGPGNPLKLEARPGVIVCQIREQLFVVPTPKLDPKLFQTPMHFERREKLFFLDSAEAKLPLPKLVGGEAPVEFSLSPEIPGVEIDKQGAYLSLNPDALRAKALETPSLRRSAQQLDAYLRDVGPIFEKLAGRKPKQTPIWAKVHVVARDKSLQTAELDYGIGLEVPVEPQGRSTQSSLERRLQNVERRLDEISQRLEKLTQGLDKKHDVDDRNK
jgi:hypothetical protein